MFISVKTSCTEEGMMVSLVLALHKSEVRHVSEAALQGFIQRSVMPHQRLSKRHGII